MDTRQSILSRFYLKDVPVDSITVQEFVGPVQSALPLIEKMKTDTLEEISEAVGIMKELGVPYFLESSRFFVTFDEKRRHKPLFNMGIFKVLKMKEDVISLYREDFDRDKYIELLRFFRLISENIRDANEELVENIVMQRHYYEDLKAVSGAEESVYASGNSKFLESSKNQKTMFKALMNTTNSKSGIEASFAGEFTNKFGNHLYCVKVSMRGQRGNSTFKVYVPKMTKSVYSLGTNVFTQNKIYEDFIRGKSTNALSALVRSTLEPTLKLTKAYKISQENAETLRRGLQTKLNSLFFSKRKVKATKDQLFLLRDEIASDIYGRAFEKLDKYERGVVADEAKEKAKKREYYFAPFTLVRSKEESITPFELLEELHKLYFKEYVTSENTSGGDILKRFGKRGYESYKGFELNNSNLVWVDPGFQNSDGKYAVAYLDDAKTSIIEMNPFYGYNWQSFRNAGSAHIIGHAFKVEGEPDAPLTVSYIPRVTPPSYNMWFALLDYEDITGLSTFDGQRLLSKHYADKLGLWEGIKIAFQGYDKGVSRVMDDDVYFVHNGEKIHVNMTSPLNFATRLNLGVIYEGLYNGKKALEGRVEQEYRNFCANPLKEEELLGTQELFVERDGKAVSLGKHFVGLMASYFVRDVDSSYKNHDLVEYLSGDGKEELASYSMGLEGHGRARIMGANTVSEYVLNAKKLDEDISKILAKTDIKIHGKRGAVVARFSREVKGFSSTAFVNNKVPRGETHAYMFRDEFDAFVKKMKNIDRSFDIEKATTAFEDGKSVFCPPALDMRSPSMDDTHTIYTKVYIRKVTSKYAKHGYIEVNPIIWSKKGGDFDGDQVILLFFPWKLKRDLQKFYGHEQHDYELSFEHKIREYIEGDLYTGIAKEYSNLSEFLMYIGKMKKDEEKGRHLQGLHLNVQTKRHAIVSASSNLFTTRVSKQLIGVAKTITMKPLMLLEDFMHVHGITDMNIRRRLLDYANAMNHTLAQETIDIQKWSDRLQDVIRLILVSYRMAEAVSATIEFAFHPTYRTFATIKKFLVDNGMMSTHTIMEDNFKGLGECRFEYKYQEYLYSALDIEGKVFNWETTEDGREFRRVLYAPENAQWPDTDDSTLALEKMIEVLNPEGEVFKKILEYTEEDMEGFDADGLFYVHKKEGGKA